MLRTLLRPGWVITHLVVIAIAVSFINLGLWQIRRHGEVAAENDRITQQLAAPPIRLDRALRQPDVDLLPTIANGRFEDQATVSLSPRSRNQRPGYEVLTPLRLDDGTALLINRGWVPLDAPIPLTPTGEVDVSGRLRAPTTSRQVLTAADGSVTSLSNVDTTVLAGQVDDLIPTAYLEVVDEAAREAGAIPRPAEPVEPEPGPHLLYAGQWFAFTLIGLVGYPLLLRRRLAERQRGASPPAAPARPSSQSETASMTK